MLKPIYKNKIIPTYSCKVNTFDYQGMPLAYLAENKGGRELRKQLIKNEIRVSECTISDLHETFYSKENIELINKQLILQVYKKTNQTFLIKPQCESDLLIIMRYIYLQDAKNLPYDIKSQVKELNCKVVSEILPTVISNVDQKIGYLRDISVQPIGPPLPINTKNIERTLPSISNIIHMIF
jgi:hypothetical protein